MPAGDRGGLRAAFSAFQSESDKQAEMRLLGRTVEVEKNEEDTVVAPSHQSNQVAGSYQAVTGQVSPSTGLTPRPLLHREPVRQLSFRCGVSLAAELRRKAAFNQLEQQEIIAEGIRRVLAELSEPPPGWQG